MFEITAQHVTVVASKKAAKQFLDQAKMILQRATSEKLKAKSSLNQMLGSPNLEFVERAPVSPQFVEVAPGVVRGKRPRKNTNWPTEWKGDCRQSSERQDLFD